MPRKKKKNLVIVESPAKARTINKYLGDEYEVAASKGHVRDLPKTRFGIDIEKGWVPTYRPLKDRKEVLAALKKQVAKCDKVFLAPDPDREGEAIAWHLKEALGLPDDRTLRVTFNEITKRAIEQAFSHPTTIDLDRVKAQEARRFLDRVVGYKLSPLLRKKVAPPPKCWQGAVRCGSTDRRTRTRNRAVSSRKSIGRSRPCWRLRERLSTRNRNARRQPRKRRNKGKRKINWRCRRGLFWRNSPSGRGKNSTPATKKLRLESSPRWKRPNTPFPRSSKKSEKKKRRLHSRRARCSNRPACDCIFPPRKR
ncbi:MAG: hypothetical protein KatS3mg105_3390 [Gemmatales bacterium]|nr:MAG: hypothetical protein KatS3mg105_3390 [Gemmatales bacterium]